MRVWIRGFTLALVLAFVSVSAWAGHQTFEGFKVVHVLLNGKPVDSDVPGILFNGRTMLPVRVLAEAIGAEVEWDADTFTASLTGPTSSDRVAELETENTSLRQELSKAQDNVTTAENLLASTRSELKEAQAKLAESSDVDNPTTTQNPITAIATPSGLKTAAELTSYLQTNYETITTQAGPISLEYYIQGPNDNNMLPYDYWIMMDWKPFAFFTDLETRISLTPAMKTATVTQLRDHAELIYKLASEAFPGKKFLGSYTTSWYKYPTIQAGFESRSYLSWQNYTGSFTTSYSDAELTTFHFYDYIDDIRF